MFTPSLFRENLFDEFMNDMTFPSIDKELYGKHAANLMKTDVRDKDGHYEVDIDLPGFKKDEIRLQLENGYLTISAAKGLDKDSKDKKGHYVRRERYAGSISRSFYVGNAVKIDDIHPTFENGILSFSVPKEEAAIEEDDHLIAIEG